jgi:hypothetical protein
MRDTNSILNKFVELLTALTWTPEGGEAQPAFGEVKRFDEKDMATAFTQLYLSEARIALVIYGGEHFATEKGGVGELTIKRTLDVYVVVSDRVLGDHQQALYGSDENPGCMKLKDLAVPALAGRILPNPDGIESIPLNADMMTINAPEEKKPKLPGRKACYIDFEIRGGVITVTTGPGPVR